MIPETGIAIFDWLLSLMDAWGYLIVFIITIFENIFIVGSLTPGETFIVVGALVSTGGGLSLPLVWLCAMAGTLIGSNLTFFAGRRLGLEGFRGAVERLSVTRVGRLLKIDPAAIDEIQAHFDEDGSKTVFLARFAVGIKNWVPAVAGAVRMPVFWFEFHTVFAAALHTTLMCAIGWFLGENMDYALQIVAGVGWFGLMVVVLVIGSLVLLRRVARRRLGHDVEAHADSEAAPSGHDES